MTKTARHPLRRRFSDGRATDGRSFKTACGAARPAYGPTAGTTTAPIARAAYRRRAVDRPVAHRRSGIPTATLGTLRIRNAPHIGETLVHGTSPHTIRLHRRPSMRRNARSAAHTRYRRSRAHRTTEKVPLAASVPENRTSPPRTVEPRCKRAAIPNHPARLRTDGSRSSPALHKNRPQNPPAGQATVPDRRHPRLRTARRLTVRQTSDCSPDYRRLRKPIARKPPPRPTGGPGVASDEKPIPARSRPRLSAPRTHGHKKNGSRSIRKPFRSIFYSCVSVSGSATRMRPQYSQMIIFLPCRMSD